METVVYKLGGSLLDFPQLPERLRTVVDSTPPHCVLIVAGGGAATNAVRQWDETFGFGETVSHELALESMRLTASLLLRLFPETTLVSRPEELTRAVAVNRWGVFDPAGLLRMSGGSSPLPASWDVTSDSIAAHVAERWNADTLVLCKSRDLPSDCSLSDAVANGLVDPYFPQAAARIPKVWWCNLRDAEPRRASLPTG